MKAKEYRVLDEAVVSGVLHGLNRAYKHVENAPSEEEIARVANYVQNDVMLEIQEWFVFDVEDSHE